jgi:DNA-binding transcriptional LysR family regulator
MVIANAMELRHFRYFVAVAREATFTRAALTLHISQPGLSRQVSDLEDEIGIRLFERGPKSVQLTEAGRHFLVQAEDILRRTDEAVRQARSIAKAEPCVIHIGYVPTLCIEIMPGALRRFQKRFPNVRVALHDLSPLEMFAQLEDRALHVGLLPQPNRSRLQRLEFRELARYTVCVAVAPSHPLATSPSVTRPQILREPLIAYSRKSYPGFSDQLKRLFGNATPPIAEEHEDSNSVFTAVESGAGFTLIASCLAKSLSARLKVLAIVPPLATVPVGIACRKGSKSYLTESFIEAASG